MYSVYMEIDGVEHVIDNNDPNDKTRVLISPQLELEENAFGSLSFSVPPTHAGLDPESRLFDISDEEILVYRFEQVNGKWVRETLPIFRGRMLERKLSSSLIYSYVFEGELSYLADSVQVPAKYENVTPEAFFKAALKVHNDKMPAKKRFKPGIVTVTDDNTADHITGKVNRGSYQTSYTNSTWDALSSMQKELGGFFQVRYELENGVYVRYLDYLKDHVKRNPAPTITFGKNLVDYADEWSLAELFTVLYPVGADYTATDVNGQSVTATTMIGPVNGGKNYIQAPAAVLDKYGVREKAVEFKGIRDPNHLLKISRLYLSNLQFDNMVLNLTALDLSDLGINETQIKFQEVVTANAPIYGMTNKDFPVTKVSIPLKNPAQAVYTMSTNSRAIRNMSTKMKDYDDAVNDALGDLNNDVGEIKQNEQLSSDSSVGGTDLWIFGYPIIYHRRDESVLTFLYHPEYISRAWDAGDEELYKITEERSVAGNRKPMCVGWKEAQEAEYTDRLQISDSAGYIYDSNSVSCGMPDDYKLYNLLHFNPYNRGIISFPLEPTVGCTVLYAVLRFSNTSARFGVQMLNNQGAYFGIMEDETIGMASGPGSETSSLSQMSFRNSDTAETHLYGSMMFVMAIAISGQIYKGTNFNPIGDNISMLVGTRTGVYEPILHPGINRGGNILVNAIHYQQVENLSEMDVLRIVECNSQYGQITWDEVYENVQWLVGRFVDGTINKDSDPLPSGG